MLWKLHVMPKIGLLWELEWGEQWWSKRWKKMGHDLYLPSAPCPTSVLASFSPKPRPADGAPSFNAGLVRDRKAQWKCPRPTSAEVQNKMGSQPAWKPYTLHTPIQTFRDTGTNKSSQPVIWWQSDFFPNVAYSFIIFRKTDLDYNLVPSLLLKWTLGLDEL